MFSYFRKLRETFDAFDSIKKGELNLSDAQLAFRQITSHSLDLKSLRSYLHAYNNTDKSKITFDKFCAIVAEFGPEGCEHNHTSVSSTNGINNTNIPIINYSAFMDPLYWRSAFLKTQHMFKFYLVQPVANVLGELTICRSFYI